MQEHGKVLKFLKPKLLLFRVITFIYSSKR